MGLSTNTRSIWFGTHAAIGSGDLANWSRDTSYDGRYLQGDPTPGTNGGAFGHIHTVSGIHLHIQNPHFHLISLGFSSGTVTINVLGATVFADHVHQHPSTPTKSETLSHGPSGVSINSDATQPEAVLGILIKPDDGNQEVPIGATGFYNRTDIPANFTVKTNINDKFIVPPGTGGDGGGTGGFATHTHTSPAHGHSGDSHNHQGSLLLADADNSRTVARGSFTINAALKKKHHTASIFSVTSTPNTTAVTVNSVPNAPVFHQLLVIENTGVSAETPDNIILPHVNAALPDGWLEQDGTNGQADLSACQIKVTSDFGKIGLTGGSNTHLHTIDNHLHTYPGHKHGRNISNTQTTATAGSSGPISSGAHSHLSLGSTTTATPTMNTQGLSMSSSDGRASFRTVIFIKKAIAPTVEIKGAEIKGASIAV